MKSNLTVSARGARCSLVRFRWAESFGRVGVCAYIAGFAAPFERDIPLIILVLSSILAVGSSFRKTSTVSSPLILLVLVFLVALGLSILFSEDIGRSVRLSASVLPAVLLFFLLAEHCNGAQDIRLVYLTFSAVGLGLGSLLLWNAWRHSGAEISVWTSGTRSPILVVPNDVAFLALVAPLSLVLLYNESRLVIKALATFSLLLTLCAVCVFQSRIAMLTLIVSVTFTATLLRPRLGLVCGFVVLLAGTLIDGLTGFPLARKFSHLWDARISLWLAAWAMFLSAPFLGHGPHTFALLYQSYLHGLSLPPWLPTELHTVVPWPHNLYLEALAEQGVIGLAALGVLLAYGVLAAWKMQRAAAGEVRIFAAGALGGLAGFCVAGGGELSFLRLWVVIILFTFLGVIARLSSIQMKMLEAG